MPTRPDINILIGAKDEASAKMRNVAKSTDGLKSSVSKLSAVKLVLDVSGLGQYSQAISAAEQGVSQLADAQHNANKSSLAFKAALAGVVAVAAFKIGSAFSGAAKDMEEFNAAQTEATALSKRLTDELARRRKMQLDILNITKSGSALRDGKLGVADDIDQTVSSREGSIRQMKAELKDLESLMGSSMGRNSAVIDLLKKNIVAATEEVSSLKKESQGIKDGVKLDDLKKGQEDSKKKHDALIAEAKAFVDFTTAIEDQNNALKHSQRELALMKAEKLNALTAEKDYINQLFDERDAIIARNEAEKEGLQLAKDAANIRSKLQEQKEALAEETQKDQKRRQQSSAGPVGELQGVESRFLTRGSVQQDPIRKENEQIIKLNKEISNTTGKLKEVLDEIADNTAKQTEGV